MQRTVLLSLFLAVMVQQVYDVDVIAQDRLYTSSDSSSSSSSTVCDNQAKFAYMLKFIFHNDVIGLNTFLVNEGFNAYALINRRSDTTHETPLRFAIRWGYLEIINVLLQHGADVTMLAYDDHYGVGHASKLQITDDNIKNRLQVELDKTLLQVSYEGSNGWIYRAIAAGANVNVVNLANGWMPIMYAAKTGNCNIIKLLIDAGVWVGTVIFVCNERKFDEYSALDIADYYGNDKAALMLEVKYGNILRHLKPQERVERIKLRKQMVNFNLLKNANKRSILMNAFLAKHPEFVDARSEKCRETSLCTESLRGSTYFATLQMLIERDANINASNCFGNTPLMGVLMKDDQRFTQFLLLVAAERNLKISFHARNFDGDTAADIAEKKGFSLPNLVKDLNSLNRHFRQYMIQSMINSQK